MRDKALYPYRIEPQYVDFTLHATIESIGNLILNTAGADAKRNGFGIDVLSEKNLSWVLSRMAIELDYRPEQYSETELFTWISDNSRMISTRNFEMRDKSGKVFCRAVSQWCLIDFVRRIPVRLDEVSDLFDGFLCDAPSPCAIPHKILEIEPTEYAEHKVVYSDIDFNRHVNTMRYIKMMIDMLPIQMLTENRPLRLDVHFLHECRFGQRLTIGYEQRGKESLFEVKSEEGTVACRASIEWR